MILFQDFLPRQVPSAPPPPLRPAAWPPGLHAAHVSQGRGCRLQKAQIQCGRCSSGLSPMRCLETHDTCLGQPITAGRGGVGMPHPIHPAPLSGDPFSLTATDGGIRGTMAGLDWSSSGVLLEKCQGPRDSGLPTGPPPRRSPVRLCFSHPITYFSTLVPAAPSPPFFSLLTLPPFFLSRDSLAALGPWSGIRLVCSLSAYPSLPFVSHKERPPRPSRYHSFSRQSFRP